MSSLNIHLEKFLYYEEVVVGKSLNTIKSYKNDIEQFIYYLENYENIDNFKNVETITLRSYIAYLNSDSDGKEDYDDITNSISKRSINRKISALRTFFKYLQEKGIIEVNNILYINMPKFEKSLPTVLTKEDINKMREIIDTSNVIGIRNRLIIELLYSSGIRSSELIELSESMVNFKDREIHVIGKGNKERITFFSNKAKIWLEKYISEKKNIYKNYDPHIIITNKYGKKLNSRSLRRIISELALKAGINKEVTPHVFRHTFATELMNNGMDIRYLQELLGHSSISTTQVYTHVSKNLLKEIYLNTHPLANEE